MNHVFQQLIVTEHMCSIKHPTGSLKKAIGEKNNKLIQRHLKISKVRKGKFIILRRNERVERQRITKRKTPPLFIITFLKKKLRP